MSYKKIFLIVSFLAVCGFLFNFGAPTAKAMTADEIRALINQLMQQIAQLQKQLAETEGKPAAWCHDFNVNLKIGDSGSEVSELKTALIKDGVWPFMTVNNEFDEETASYVVAFQQKYKDEILAPFKLKFGTGFMGKATRSKLNKLYGCGITVTPPITTTPPVSTAAPSIAVLSPNGGEKWTEGQTYTITWKHNLAGNFEAWIDLLKGGTYYGSIAGDNVRISNAQNLTFYSWRVGDMKGGVGPGSDYQIRITYNDVNTRKMLTDNSDNYFSIVAATTDLPDLQITDLTWTPVYPNPNQQISFVATVKNNSLVDVSNAFSVNLGGIASTISSLKAGVTTQVSANFGLSIPGQNNVNVRVDIWNNVAESNEQNNDFSKTVIISTLPDLAPTVITYPSVIQKGNIVLFDSGVKNNGPVSTNDFNIKWFVDDVQVGYGAHKGLWANWTLMDDNSRYYWTALESVHTIKFVVDADNHIKESDETNNTAQVTVTVPGPSITVLLPNGGERWERGKIYTVRWESKGVNQVKIYIVNPSISGSGSTNYIVPNNQLVSASTGYYNWTVGEVGLPAGVGEGAVYKIRIDDVDSNLSDYSDNYFSIVEGTIGLKNIENQVASISEAISKLMEGVKELGR